MTVSFRTVFESFIGPLSTVQRTVLAVLLSTAMVTGIAQALVVRHALRDAGGSRRFAWWGWDIRMLRRSYYPETGQHLHPTILRLYIASLFATLIVFVLLVRWVVL